MFIGISRSLSLPGIAKSSSKNTHYYDYWRVVKEVFIIINTPPNQTLRYRQHHFVIFSALLTPPRIYREYL